MAAVFILCVRKCTRGSEILLGRKHDGKLNNRGLTVPAGKLKRRDVDRRATAVRELFEETGVKLEADQLQEFRIEGGDYWYLARLHQETPRTEPELNPQTGKPVWGPAEFFPIDALPVREIASWQRTKLRKAIAQAID